MTKTQRCVRKFRIPDKSHEINSNTCARDRIFGVHNRFQFDDPIITKREEEKKIMKLCQTILRSDVTPVRQLSEII